MPNYREISRLSLSGDVKIGGAVFVAGFFKRVTGLEDEPGNVETINHWLDSPIDFMKVKSRLNKSIAIFSDNDPYVSLNNKDDFEKELGSRIIIEHAQGHFTGSDNITQLPIALKSILEISS